MSEDNNKLNILITAMLSAETDHVIGEQLEQLSNRLAGKLKLSPELTGQFTALGNLVTKIGDGTAQITLGDAVKDAQKFNKELQEVNKQLKAVKSERAGIVADAKGKHEAANSEGFWTDLKRIGKPKLPRKGEQMYEEVFSSLNFNERSRYFVQPKHKDQYKSASSMDEIAHDMGLTGGSDELLQRFVLGQDKFEASKLNNDPKFKEKDNQVKALEEYRDKLEAAKIEGKDFAEVSQNITGALQKEAGVVEELNGEIGNLTKVSKLHDDAGNPLAEQHQFKNPEAGQTTTHNIGFDDENNPYLKTVRQDTDVKGLQDSEKKFQAFTKEFTNRTQAIAANTKLPQERVLALADAFSQLESHSDKLDIDIFKKELISLEKYADNLHRIDVEQQKLRIQTSKLKLLDPDTVSGFNNAIDSSKNLKQIDLLKNDLKELEQVEASLAKGQKEKENRIVNLYKLGKKQAEQELKDINNIEEKNQESAITARRRERLMGEAQQRAIQKAQEAEWDDRDKLGNQMGDGRGRGSYKAPDWNGDQKKAQLDNIELEKQANAEMEAAFQKTLSNRAKQEREWNQAQQEATAKNAERQRAEDTKTQEKREEYQNWYLKALREQEIKQDELAKKELADIEKLHGKAIEQNKVYDGKMANRRSSIRDDLYGLHLNKTASKETIIDLAKQANTSKLLSDLDKVEAEIKRIKNVSKLPDMGEILGVSENFRNVGELSNSAFKKELKTILQTNEELKDKKILLAQIDNITGEWTATVRMNGLEQKRIGGIIDQNTGALHRQKMATQELSNAHKGMMEQFKIALTRVPVWMGAMTLFYGTSRAIQNMVQNIVEIDTQMTQLKRVMDEDTNFDKMLEKSIGLAKELSQSVQDVNTALIGFAQQGYNPQDALDLTKTALVASNVSELTSKEAMDDITAAMTNFNIVASNSITIIDKLNEVDNNFAVTTKDLAEAVHKAGATAVTYGVSLDELVGQIAAIGTATRESGNVIGNGLKTIYSRIPAKQSVDALQGMAGIDVFNDNGSAKAATQVLQELSEKWDDLTNTQQQNIAVAVAGRYQLTRFLALMQNWDIAVKATESSLTSQGSAMRENEKQQESLQARINRLKVAWQELSLAVGDAVLTDSFIAILNGLTSLAHAASSLIKIFGVLPAVFAVLTAAILLMNQRTRESIIATGKLGFTMQGLKVSLLSMAGAARVVGAVLAGIAWPMAAAMLFGFVLEKVIGFFSSLGEARKKALELNTETVMELRKEQSGLSDLADEYDKLKSKSELSGEEKQRLLDIQRELVSSYGVNITGIDAEGQAYTDSVSAIQQRIKALKEEIKTEVERNEVRIRATDIDKKDSAKQMFEERAKAAEKVLRIQKDITDAQEAYARGDYNKGQETYDGHGEDVYRQQIEGYNEELALALQGLDNVNAKIAEHLGEYANVLRQKANLIIAELQSNGKDISDEERAFIEMLANGIAQSSDSYDNQVEALNNAIDNVDTSQYEVLQKQYQDLLRSFYDNPTAENKTALEIKRQEIIKAVDGIIAKVKQGLADGETVFKDFAKLLAEGLQIPTPEATTIVPNIEGMAAKFKEATGEISSINQAIQDVNKEGKLNAGTIADLVTRYKQLIPHVIKTKDGYVIEKSALEKLRKERLEASKDAMLQEAGLSKAVLLNLGTRLKGYGIEIQAIKTAADARQKAAELMNPDIFKDGKDVFSIAKNWAIAVGSEQDRKDVSGQLNEWAGIMDQFDDLAAALSSPNFGVSSSKSGGSKNVELHQMDKYQQRMNELDTAYKKSETAAGKLVDTTAEYRKELLTQYSILSKMKTATNDEVARLNKKIAADEKQLKALGDVSKASNETKEKYNDLAKAIDDNKDKVANLTQKMDDLSVQMEAKAFEEVTSKLNEFEKKVADVDHKIALLDHTMKAYKNTSAEYRKNIQAEIDALETKKNILHEQADAIREELKNTKLSARSIEELKQRLKDLSLAWLDTNDAQTSKESEMTNSYLQEQADIIADIDYKLNVLSETTSQYVQGTKEYNDALIKNIALLGDKLAAEKNNEKVIREQIEANKNNQDMLIELNDKLQESALNQLKIMSQIQDTQESMADDIISSVKKMYEEQRRLRNDAIDEELKALEKAHDDKMKQYDDEMSKYEELVNAKLKLIDKEASKRDHDNSMAEKQAKKLEIQQKISTLSLDDSNEAKKQRSDLEKELADISKEIEDEQFNRTKDLRKEELQDQLDNKKKQVEEAKDTEEYLVDGVERTYEKAKEFLELQRKEVEKYYDGLLSDEAAFDKLKEEIMKGHFENVNKILAASLTSYAGTLDKQLIATTNKLKTQLELIKALQDEIVKIEKTNSNAGSGTSPSTKTGEPPARDSAREAAWQDYLNNKKLYEEQVAKTGKQGDPKLAAANIAYREQYGFKDGTYAELSKMDAYGNLITVAKTLAASIASSVESVFGLKDEGGLLGAIKTSMSGLLPNILSGAVASLQGIVGGINGKESTTSTTTSTTNQINVNVKAVGADKNGAKEFADVFVTELNKNGVKV